jgi:hypothetical protein
VTAPVVFADLRPNAERFRYTALVRSGLQPYL